MNDALSSAARPGTTVNTNLTYRRRQWPYCKKLVVAVHGMGDQSRNDFVQNIAQLFAEHYVQETGSPHQATRLPVGAWDSGPDDPRGDDVLGFVPADGAPWLEQFGFAEVYWAHIARDLQTAGYRLEESKKWAASVVERLSQREGLRPPASGEVAIFGKRGPLVAATVVSEVAETLRILDLLLSMARKAGFIDLNLPKILEAYLGDVQQVADFMDQRRRIRRQFLLRMQDVVAKCRSKDGALPDDFEIHLVAHSEGTVVAFLGLLYALRQQTQEVVDRERRDDPAYGDYDFSWIHKVRSFTTLGSPIDKHIVLWPDIWYKYKSTKAWVSLRQPIRWRNYYDLADPVGFELNSAREALTEWGCQAFDFAPSGHDHGFRRYPLPGVAHVNYFGDVPLFGHIIRDAIQHPVKPPAGPPPPAQPPDTLKGKCSSWLPFVFVALIIAAAVFILHKAVTPQGAETFSGSIAGNAVTIREVPASTVGYCPPELAPWQTGVWGVLGCTALLYGTTILVRVLRITGNPCAISKALVAWLAGAALFWLFPGCNATQVLPELCAAAVRSGNWITGLWGGSPWHVPAPADFPLWRCRAFIIALSAGLIVVAAWIDWRQIQKRKPPVWGLRYMMIFGGGTTVALFILPRLADSAPNQHPLALLTSGAAFIYLWWLATLLFDLAFVWKTYINTTAPSFVRRVSAKLSAAPPPAGPAKD